TFNRRVDIASAVEDRVDGFADRHFDAPRGGEAHDGLRRVDALRDRAPARQNRSELLALPELLSQAHVAGLRARAGQHEITEPREADQGFALCAERRAKTPELRETTRQKRGVRAGAEPCAEAD